MEVFRELQKATARWECDHCNFRGTDYENVQIHMGTVHPEFCDEMDTGGLGKMIFYQKSAKLFHCHKCFFTSKMYSNVYHHITSKHAAPERWGDKPKHELHADVDPVKSPPLSEHQKTSSHSAELKSAPSLSLEPPTLGPNLSPESPKSPLEPPKPGPGVSSDSQTPLPSPVSSPELPRPGPAPSPEPQRLGPVSPELVKSPLVNPKAQKHSHFPETLGPPPALSPGSPVLNASPEPWGPSPTASPESRKPAQAASPEPRKPSPSESPEPWKPFPAVSPEPRRPTPAVSPGSWKPGPPGSPRPWKSSPSATSGPWKPAKPAPSVSPGPWRPIPSVSPGPWKPTPSATPATWKSSGSWKTPPTSPESWKSGPPELRKTAPTLSPEPWKAVPAVSPELCKAGPPPSPEIRSPAASPELRKRSGSPDLWKLSPEQRKTSPGSLDFPESQKSSRGGSPDVWKSSFFIEPQKPVFPDTRKPGPPGPSESPKTASDIWKPILSIDTEPRKPPLFAESTKTAPPASPELRKRALFPEPWKHSLFPELPRSALFSESQKAAELSGELQVDAISEQEELVATPKKLLEDTLFPSSKKLKKDNQDSSDAELSSSEYIKTDLDALDIKGQESSSDQEQVDVESVDFSKDSKMDLTSPEQSKNVPQFTEEKEAFISEEEIAKYMKRGKGKYYCKICCCRAMKKGAVLHHLVNKHNVHSPYKCTICGKAFLLESLLKNHVAAHGQSLLKCPRCNFESNFPRGFKKHLTHCQSRHNEEANKKLMEALEPSVEEQQI
ncbi:chromosome alignment-maintaining phosphoprotein 1 [Ochotona curzoniae]|uniref:chromosome alignment-maintaining phosphoprotein 1 n=1 Tax=Ochotona curzoniae TaxID=130825 RepID=UPI001B34639C|nr:chromosome alignment-maintaining phosphoprotein 1 [Ochotona curzoniae]XP_040847025.1 chromosome alignment-maintaining phosphoprotein 1 [Ochotona curzoniae]